MEIQWKYKGKVVENHNDLHVDCQTIVYELAFSDGTKYIGKKQVRSESVLPAQKKGVRKGAERVYRHILRDESGNIITSKAGRAKARKQGIKAKREEFDRLLTDKPFIKYEGSSDENKGKTLVSKEILYQSSNKKTATYIETALLFENDVLFSDTFNNKNIGGVYFDNSLEGLIDDRN